MLRLVSSHIKTPTGDMFALTDAQARLRAFEWCDLEGRMKRLFTSQYKSQPYEVVAGSMPMQITQALDAYFSGDLHALDKLETAAEGTPFQRQVWAALRDISVGQTRSYSDIAIAIGNPKSVRAIGAANGSNAIGIVVPCHRVIGANGSMTGYGGGLPRKEWLLRHEGALNHGLI